MVIVWSCWELICIQQQVMNPNQDDNNNHLTRGLRWLSVIFEQSLAQSLTQCSLCKWRLLFLPLKGNCDGLNMFVSPQEFTCWKPNPQGGGIRISAFVKEGWQCSLALPLWGICHPEGGASPDHAGTLVSDFQPPGVWEISVAYKLLSLQDFVIAAWTD